MPHDHLDSLARAGTLKIEEATTQEISGLIRSGTARLADCRISLWQSLFGLSVSAAYVEFSRQPMAGTGSSTSKKKHHGI